MPTPGPDGGGDAAEVLVIGWYPAADAVAAGRFIADQVAALLATGRVRPSVVAFENASLRGPDELRERAAAAVRSNVRRALGARDPFVVGGAEGAPGVPIARLAIAGGPTPASGIDHRAIHRTDAVLRLLDATPQPRWRLVHGHVGYPEGVASAAAATRLGIPLVVTEHARFLTARVADPVIRERYRRAMLAARRVVAVGRVLAAEIASIVPEMSDRIVVIPNAVDVETFRPRLGEPRVTDELLWVGNRVETKGIETLLRAFAVVHAQRPTATLRLVGPAAPRDRDARWATLAAELGVRDAVRFEPATDRIGVAAAMARADVFVHPSPFETFGIVAAEALAAGLPVVATDSGGVTEVMGDQPESLGAIVPPEDPAALAAGIQAALARRSSFDPERLRAAVLERFGADRVAHRVADLYDEVLAEPPPVDRTATATARPVSPPDAARVAPQAPPRPAPGRTIVVSFSRLELDRALEAFPAAVTRAATLVTTGGRIPGHPSARLAPAGSEAAVAELIGWGDGRGSSVILRTVGRLVSAARSRFPFSSDHISRSLLRTLATTLETAINETSDAPLVVCVSGLDHLVAEPFIASGAAIAAPGGLRWLADARAADERSGSGGAPGATHAAELSGGVGARPDDVTPSPSDS